MKITIEDWKKRIVKDSVVELKIDGVVQDLTFSRYQFSEEVSPRLNQITKEVDDRYSSDTTLVFNIKGE